MLADANGFLATASGRLLAPGGVRFDAGRSQATWLQLSDDRPTLDPMLAHADHIGAMTTDPFDGHPDAYVWGGGWVFPDYPLSSQWGHFYTKNAVGYVKLGRTDDVEVGCTYRIEDWQHSTHQIGPVAHVNPHATDPIHLGVTVNYDITIFKTTGEQVFIAQNAFAATDPALNFDHDFYLAPITEGAANNWEHNLFGKDITIRLFSVGGQQRYMMTDGTNEHWTDVWDTPEWAVGVDGWGVRSLALWVPDPDTGPFPSYPYMDGLEPVNTPPKPDTIKSWWARSIDGPMPGP